MLAWQFASQKEFRGTRMGMRSEIGSPHSTLARRSMPKVGDLSVGISGNLGLTGRLVTGLLVQFWLGRVSVCRATGQLCAPQHVAVLTLFAEIVLQWRTWRSKVSWRAILQFAQARVGQGLKNGDARLTRSGNRPVRQPRQYCRYRRESSKFRREETPITYVRQPAAWQIRTGSYGFSAQNALDIDNAICRGGIELAQLSYQTVSSKPRRSP